MMRKPILRLYVPREEDSPVLNRSMYSLGTATYLKYPFHIDAALLQPHILLSKHLTFFNPVRLLLRIVF